MATDKAYFFSDSRYWRYDVASSAIDATYPKPLSSGWSGMPFSSMDAVVNWGNGKMYMFSGTKYARATIGPPPAIDADYPLDIAGQWGALPFTTIDAAVNLGNGKAFFFSGTDYAQFDIVGGDMDPGFPKPIAGNWPGLFRGSIDAALNWGDGKAYFFSGTDYVRWDIASNRADAGYPLVIASQWGATFPVPVTAAVERTAGPAIAPRCLPVFEPGFWNDGVDPRRLLDRRSIQKQNNCYNYATDLPNSRFAQPGEATGHPAATTDCPSNTTGARSDGLASVPTPDPCAGCCHLVALVIAPTMVPRDFHWYRRDADGTWSHKRGGTVATNVDFSGTIITDPRTANRGLYTDFCGFFCVCKDRVTISGPGTP